MKTRAGTTIITMVLTLLTGTAMAAVFSLVDDDFSDGNRNGWYLDGDDASTDLGVVSGALRLSDTDGTTDNNSVMVGTFAAANLSRIGTKITLTLNFRNLENHPLNRGLGIGLYNSQGTIFSSDVAFTDGAQPGSDDSGYFVYTRRNPALQRLYENNGKGISDSTASANRDNGSISFGLADGWHTYKMVIETIDDGSGEGEDRLDQLITVTFDEGLATEDVLSYQDEGVFGTLSVDEIGIISMKGLDVEIDNVRVTYDDNIPEPGTAALALLAIPLLAALKGKKVWG